MAHRMLVSKIRTTYSNVYMMNAPQLMGAEESTRHRKNTQYVQTIKATTFSSYTRNESYISLR